MSAVWNFNSHAHVERDNAMGFTQYTESISTHTLTWSVTWRRALKTYGQVHFNSHAHVERDAKGTRKRNTNEISTHTLTWSVTKNFVNFCFFVYISTHTLTWSVTETAKIVDGCIDISTHTLTWSVTYIPTTAATPI